MALRQAAPGGLVRVFADIGPRLWPLLDVLARRDDAPALVHQIQSAIRGATPSSAPPSSAPPAAPSPHLAQGVAEPAAAPSSQIDAGVELVEALTARELDVLAAMAQHLTSREIAERLGVSVHTIKHHIGNILGKLGVADRRQAVARARALGLLRAVQHH